MMISGMAGIFEHGSFSKVGVLLCEDWFELVIDDFGFKFVVWFCLVVFS